MINQDPPPPYGSQRNLANRLSLSLSWGFALLMGLMVALIIHAVWHISDLEDRMRHIVKDLNQKIQLATDLQEATYNRHSALVYQTLSKDPFERDDNFQLYIKWGYQVGKARNDLKAMPLDTFEKANLMQQDPLVAKIIVLHEQISDLASLDQTAKAQAIMARDLRPLNLQFTEMVERLRRHERDQVRVALMETEAASRQAIRLHLGLGAILMILAILIAVATHSLMARHSGIISKQMSDLEEAGNRLEHEATHDPLTGLANRALFHRRMAEGLDHAQQERFLLGVMYLDLDNFKQVNDTHGHAVGDALLKETAQRLRQVVRVSDTVARLGGDEFAIVLTGLEDTAQCEVLRRKIEDELARPADLEGVSLTPSGSVGCVVYPWDGKSLQQLLKVADQRMYESKRAHKGESDD